MLNDPGVASRPHAHHFAHLHQQQPDLLPTPKPPGSQPRTINQAQFDKAKFLPQKAEPIVNNINNATFPRQKEMQNSVINALAQPPALAKYKALHQHQGSLPLGLSSKDEQRGKPVSTTLYQGNYAGDSRNMQNLKMMSNESFARDMGSKGYFNHLSPPSRKQSAHASQFGPLTKGAKIDDSQIVEFQRQYLNQRAFLQNNESGQKKKRNHLRESYSTEAHQQLRNKEHSLSNDYRQIGDLSHKTGLQYLYDRTQQQTIAEARISQEKFTLNNGSSQKDLAKAKRPSKNVSQKGDVSRVSVDSKNDSNDRKMPEILHSAQIKGAHLHQQKKAHSQNRSIINFIQPKDPLHQSKTPKQAKVQDQFSQPQNFLEKQYQREVKEPTQQFSTFNKNLSHEKIDRLEFTKKSQHHRIQSRLRGQSDPLAAQEAAINHRKVIKGLIKSKGDMHNRTFKSTDQYSKAKPENIPTDETEELLRIYESTDKKGKPDRHDRRGKVLRPVKNSSQRVAESGMPNANDRVPSRKSKFELYLEKQSQQEAASPALQQKVERSKILNNPTSRQIQSRPSKVINQQAVAGPFEIVKYNGMSKSENLSNQLTLNPKQASHQEPRVFNPLPDPFSKTHDLQHDRQIKQRSRSTSRNSAQKASDAHRTATGTKAEDHMIFIQNYPDHPRAEELRPDFNSSAISNVNSNTLQSIAKNKSIPSNIVGLGELSSTAGTTGIQLWKLPKTSQKNESSLDRNVDSSNLSQPYSRSNPKRKTKNFFKLDVNSSIEHLNRQKLANEQQPMKKSQPQPTSILQGDIMSTDNFMAQVAQSGYALGSQLKSTTKQAIVVKQDFDQPLTHHSVLETANLPNDHPDGAETIRKQMLTDPPPLEDTTTGRENHPEAVLGGPLHQTIQNTNSGLQIDAGCSIEAKKQSKSQVTTSFTRPAETNSRQMNSIQKDFSDAEKVNINITFSSNKNLLQPIDKSGLEPSLHMDAGSNLLRANQLSQMSQNNIFREPVKPVQTTTDKLMLQKKILMASNQIHDALGPSGQGSQRFTQQPHPLSQPNLLAPAANLTSQKLYKKQAQTQLQDMILKLINEACGAKGAKGLNFQSCKVLFKKNLEHMSLLSGLNENQLYSLILTYYQQQGQKKDSPHSQTPLSSNSTVGANPHLLQPLNVANYNVEMNPAYNGRKSSINTVSDGGHQSKVLAGNMMPNNTGHIEPNLLLKAKPNGGSSNPSSVRHLDGVEEDEGTGLKKTKRMSQQVGKELTAQQQHFFMSLNCEGDTLVPEIKSSSGLKKQTIQNGEDSHSPMGSPALHPSVNPIPIKNGLNGQRKILSNRQKLLNKISKNINIIQPTDALGYKTASQFEGLLNIGSKQVVGVPQPNGANSAQKNIFYDGHLDLKAHSSRMNNPTLVMGYDGQLREVSRGDEFHLRGTNPPFNERSKQQDRPRDHPAPEMKGQAEFEKAGHGSPKNNQRYTKVEKSSRKSRAQNRDKSASKQHAKKESTPSQMGVDFDLEYAKLIAKQFPIHDDNGSVIDYSNINEFQLELLALHEEYGEEHDMGKKRRIFEKLANMNEEDYYRHKRRKAYDHRSQIDLSTSASTAHDGRARQKPKRPFGPHVGKEGGNPDYKKNVIQLEKERIEKERQELILKRKRNSNYIQQCIRHGNEHYNEQKLNSLQWLKKEKDHHDVDANGNAMNKIDERNLEILKKKQEIIAKYNKMSKENKPTLAEDGFYRFTMLRGNNSNLVMKVLLSRDYWQELEEKHLTLYSFKWSPVSRGINYEQLGAHGQKKLVNHLERHDLLTTKDQLYINMHKYCETNKINVFQYLPIQFVLDLSAKSFIHEVDRFCQYFNSIEKVKASNQDIEQQLHSINQHILANKNLYIESKYKVARRFVLDRDMYDGGNVWLIKPNDFNRGRGVRLFNSLEQLRKLMKEFSLGNEMDFYVHNACCQILANEKHMGTYQQAEKSAVKQSEHTPDKSMASSPPKKPSEVEMIPGPGPNLTANVKSEVFVIQKYIERPLLIDDRKFDIRLWVLVNMMDMKDQRCYLFKEGYIRTSSSKFTLDSIDQPFIHLTNNAVQQYDQNYGKLEEGNQLSFKQGSDLLKKQAGVNLDFYELLDSEITPIIETTFKCVEGGRLNPNGKKHTFEIFGYDFMVDQQLRPWLIEVNTNPCLEETSKLLRSILPRMIDDAFRLTLDTMFPPPLKETGETGQKTESFPVEGYTDSENLWKHIYTLKP